MSAKRKRKDLDEINKRVKTAPENVINMFYVNNSIEKEINKTEEPPDVLISIQMLFNTFKKVLNYYIMLFRHYQH